MAIGLHVKYRYCCPVLMKLEFSRQIFKNTEKYNFTKIQPLGAELFHTDRHDEAVSPFLLFCKHA
jgi:hypothetical protein